MEERAPYTLTPPIEAAFKVLALKAAAAAGYTLTPEQTLALATELAQELADTPGSGCSRVLCAAGVRPGK